MKECSECGVTEDRAPIVHPHDPYFCNPKTCDALLCEPCMERLAEEQDAHNVTMMFSC